MTDHLKANIRYVSPLSAGELTAKSRGSTPALFFCFRITPFCTHVLCKGIILWLFDEKVDQRIDLDLGISLGFD